MVAIWKKYQQCNVYSTFWPHHYVEHARKPYRWQQKWWIWFYAAKNDIDQMAAILDFTHNAMSKVFFDHNTMSGTPFKPHSSHQNQESVTILKKIISIYCSTLNIWRPTWILPTRQCPKVRSGHTTMSGVPENPMVYTKITNLLLFCRQLNQFIVWPCTNGGHLGFQRNFFNW